MRVVAFLKPITFTAHLRAYVHPVIGLRTLADAVSLGPSLTVACCRERLGRHSPIRFLPLAERIFKCIPLIIE